MALQDYITALQKYDVVYAIVIVIAAYVIGQVVKLIINRVAKKLTKKTKTSLDDELLHATGTPLLAGITGVGIYIALLTISYLSPYEARIHTGAQIAGILWGSWLAMRIIKGLFIWYGKEIASKTKSKMDDKYLHVFRRIINIILFAVVGMMILSSLGVQITPLIASLGIGGLAIALALQDTLANFFSGFYMISDRAVQIGDYVEIEAPGGTVKGNVEDIGWRTSKIKTLANNHVIVPNSSFANSVVINYQAPNSEMSLLVNVGVSYSSDLDRVEKITNEVIQDMLKNFDGCVKDAEPMIRYREFADSSITFIAIIRISDPVKQGWVRHEFIKRLKRRFDQEGIEIPFPQRDIHMKQ